MSPPSFLYTYETWADAPLRKAADPVYMPNGNELATSLVLPVDGKITALTWERGLKLVGMDGSPH